jgi:hypothetical protein
MNPSQEDITLLSSRISEVTIIDYEDFVRDTVPGEATEKHNRTSMFALVCYAQATNAYV